jgi:cell division protein ZapA (FtsZ GTPase activity inhibitor)
MVTIELFGQPYTFKADTEVVKANQVADLLRREVQKVQDQQTGPSTHIPKLTLMILAALNIAHNIIQLKNDTGGFMAQLDARCEALDRMLDEGLTQLRAPRQHGRLSERPTFNPPIF